jgi:hypothetical protein
MERFFARLSELDSHNADVARAEVLTRRQREMAEASREAKDALG